MDANAIKMTDADREATLQQTIDTCRAAHCLPLPGRRMLVWYEGATDGALLEEWWLANESPPGTPASLSKYRIRYVRRAGGIARAFETCPACEQNGLESKPMSYQSGRMACVRCNRLWFLPDSPAVLKLACGVRVA